LAFVAEWHIESATVSVCSGRRNSEVAMSVFPRPDIWAPHRVSYGETDAMGVLYYAEYLHIFERARSELIRSRGMSYAVVEERGIILPVREANCRYRAPARYDDLLRVHTAVTEWGRASVVFGYEIYDEDKAAVLATGFTQHAVLSSGGRPVAVPDWLKRLFIE
jgi:acyl-CoA thioester hydrolase